MFLRPRWVRQLAVILVCVLLGGCAVACSSSAQVRTVYGLGAVLQLVSYDGIDLWYDYAVDLIDNVQSAVDSANPDGDVARYNAAAPGALVPMGTVAYQMLQVAQTAYQLTQGGYDCGTYWLVDLWGFSPRAQSGADARPYDRSTPSVPDAVYIEAFASLVGQPLRWVIDSTAPSGYALQKPDCRVQIAGVEYTAAIDLGGIAKGWVIQRLVEQAQRLGIKRGYASFGTSSVALLANRTHSDWDLRLTHPRAADGQTYCSIACANRCVSTSGDYENYFEVHGKRYSHLLDPATGYPIDNGICSVTLLGEDAALLDALSTGLAVRGLAYIQQWLSDNADLHIDAVVTYTTPTGLAYFTTLPAPNIDL